MSHVHKDYDHKGSVGEKVSGRDPQKAWHQDELVGGKVTLTTSKDVSPEAEKCTALEAVSKQRLVKTQQTEKA
jgi:hypothetical protein